MTYTLRPLSGGSWDSLRAALEEDKSEQDATGPAIEAEETSIHDVTRRLESANGAVLNANRETRVKLYVGQVSYAAKYFLFSHRVYLRVI